jgi:hypothetical protein
MAKTTTKKKGPSLAVGRGEKLPVSKGAGLTAKGRAKYNAATGSNLKAPQPEGGPRKKSFCARMSGMPGPMKDENGMFVIAHSETGHNHVMERNYVEAFQPKNVKEVDLYEMFLMVKEPTEINHLRSFDTHEPLLVPPGNYVIKRQREYTPEGFRRAAD